MLNIRKWGARFLWGPPDAAGDEPAAQADLRYCWLLPGDVCTIPASEEGV